MYVRYTAVKPRRFVKNMYVLDLPARRIFILRQCIYLYIALSLMSLGVLISFYINLYLGESSFPGVSWLHIILLNIILP